MGTYEVMKKLILNGNQKFENREVSKAEWEEYGQWKKQQKGKLDTFHALDRLTQNQYKELAGMFLEEPEDQAEEQEAAQPAEQ